MDKYTDAIGILCLTLLIVLMAGEPDILDAIIHRLMECKHDK